MNKLKNLPYGNQLQNIAPIPGKNINLIVGETKAWSLAKNRIAGGIPALVMSPYYEPMDYQYPVSGWDVLIIDFGIKSISFTEKLFLVLSKAGATFIYLISSDNRILNGMSWEASK